MSYCTAQILLLAGSIYSGIGAPSAQSIGYVSGWITNSGSLGDINNRLTTCFYLDTDAPCIVGFGPEEAVIYTEIYEMNYYESQALATLVGGGTYWLNMKEGDTSISRESPVKIAKAYRDLQDAAQKQLQIAVANWKVAHANPATVDASDLYSWPTP